MVVNTFLIPIFSYLFSYFVIPAPHVNAASSSAQRKGDLARDIRRNLGPWMSRFSSMGLDEHCRPTDLLGLKAPMIYFPLWNYALLASRAAFPFANNVIPGSMRMKGHSQLAAQHLCGPGSGLTVSGLLGKPPKVIYDLVNTSTAYCVGPEGYLKPIRTKMQKSWRTLFPDFDTLDGPLVSTSPADRNLKKLLDNWKHLPSWVPDYARCNFLNTLLNALPTAARLSHLHKPERQGQRISARQTGPRAPHSPVYCACLLCGQGSDSAAHLYNLCPTVASVIASCRTEWGLPAPKAPGFAHSVFGLDLSDGTHFAMQILLNHAIWRVRVETENAAPPAAFTAAAMYELVRSDLYRRFLSLSPSSLSLDCFPHSTLPAAVTLKAQAATGGDKHTPAGAAAARNSVAPVVSSLPVGAIQLWTDGSANPNPGPAGAGALLKGRGLDREFAAFLGLSTNNVGEA